MNSTYENLGFHSSRTHDNETIDQRTDLTTYHIGNLSRDGSTVFDPLKAPEQPVPGTPNTPDKPAISTSTQDVIAKNIRSLPSHLEFPSA